MIKKTGKITIVILLLTALVIFVQWYTINKPQEIILSDQGENQIYAYEKDSGYLMPKTKMKPALQVIRRTENTWIVRIGILQKTYIKDRDNVFIHLSDAKELSQEDKKIAILHISTGEDIKFWNRFYNAMDRYFLPNHDKTYFLFTDHDYLPVKKDVVKIHQEKLVGTDRLLKQFQVFDKISEQLKEFDYIYVFNGDILPVSEITEGVFPTTEQGYVFLLHPKYFRTKAKELPYDRNSQSKSYISNQEGTYYIIAGFNGGTSDSFFKLNHALKEWSEIDLSNSITPYKYDESMLNRYFENIMKLGNEKPLILLPEYAMPSFVDKEKYGQINEFFDYAKMSIIEKDF